jgi:tetratricopeptide (TPR) repeat protein/DNA-binding MarR family transcriptional regulator
MPEIFLSRFTPSLSSPEALESITVGRSRELERIAELVDASVTTKAKHHVLLIGPRGIGKTHLISVINHRLQSNTNLKKKMLVVWLREEEWGVSSFPDLLARILRTIAENTENTENEENEKSRLKPEEIESLFDVPPPEAARVAIKLLKRAAGKRTLVLLAENLGDIFSGIGEEGQQKLRSFIQENPFISIVATTQSLFPEVSSQTKPFYGFFRPYHLNGLTFDEAVNLLVKIAELKKDASLAAYLKTPEGRARVRAVHHLVGGNPRLYVIFSEFLSRSTVEDLVTPFMKMLDELTPYYQERMRWLSPQQRQIVEIMCDAGKPISVKDIARRAFVTHQTASSQLKQLREHNYVNSRQFGRESLYELREPLMRLTVEVKKKRGEPIRLLVDFLRLWYSPDEIQSRIEMLGGEPSLESNYLSRAHLELLSATDDPRIAVCKADYNEAIGKKDFKSAFQAAEEMAEIKSSYSNWYLKLITAQELRWSDEAKKAERKLKEIEPQDASDYYFCGEYYLHRNKLSDAVGFYHKAVELKPDLADAWIALTNALMYTGDYKSALDASDKSIEIAPEDINSLYFRGHILANLGNFEEAKPVYQKVIDLTPTVATAWANMGWLHCQFKKFKDALPYVNKAVELAPDDSKILTNRGWALAGLSRHEEAVKDFNRALELDAGNMWAFNNKGFSLIDLGRFEEALELFERYVRLAPGDDAAWDGLGQIFFHLERHQESLEATERALQLNRRSGTAWSVHGAVQSILGKHGRALVSLDQALANGDHSSITLFFRAVALVVTGREDEGFAELDHAFSHACCTHGVNVKSVVRLFELIYHQFEERWADFIRRIIDCYVNYHLITPLGAALVKFLLQTLRDNEDREKTARWIKTWQDFIEQYPALDFPAELLDVAWRYRQTGDESILWTLPEEEREIIADFSNSRQDVKLTIQGKEISKEIEYTAR